jgi:hypothetical protein
MNGEYIHFPMNIVWQDIFSLARNMSINLLHRLYISSFSSKYNMPFPCRIKSNEYCCTMGGENVTEHSYIRQIHGLCSTSNGRRPCFPSCALTSDCHQCGERCTGFSRKERKKNVRYGVKLSHTYQFRMN